MDQEEQIRDRLKTLESEEDIVVCLAVESGSRAWGFPSVDSDYDVRFIYVWPPEQYLSIDVEEKRDVIERPLNSEIDLSGWDLRKALKLFGRSNPPLLEWLQSPTVYVERFSVADRLRKLLPRFYSPKACFHHYLHMAQGNFREYLKGDFVWRKKYLYVLRPLLAIRWIEDDRGPVPIEFERLLAAVVAEPTLKAAIHDLLNEKRAGHELGRGPRSQVISEFIESELERHGEGEAAKTHPPTPNLDELNELFRLSLSEIWGARVTV